LEIKTERKVIYGSAGTGKSTYLIDKINYYSEKYNLNSKDFILCSFTKTAAKVLSNKSNIKIKHIGTIHSLCFQMCKFLPEYVIDNEKLKEFSKKYKYKFNFKNIENSETLLGDFYLALYNLAKNKMVTDLKKLYSESEKKGNLNQFIKFCDRYEEFKKENNYIDYADMLYNAYNQYDLNTKVLIVDEAQDLSLLQWKIVYDWALNIPIVIIAGDDDQSIFEWAGARLNGMQEFEHAFNCERVVLNKSYRLPVDVFKKSQNLIQKLENRVFKDFKPTDKQGTINYYNNVLSVKNINYNDDILILYRNHFFRSQIESQLIKLGLPYKIDGKHIGYCDIPEFRALKIFLSLKNEKLKSYDLTEKQTNVMTKFFYSKYKKLDINTTLLHDWETVFNFEYKKKKYLKSLLKLNKDLKFNYTIKLNTIHGAKGKEAERVIVINSLGNKFSRFSKQKKETEIRVFYVALTRTKNRLDIVNGDNSFRLISNCGII